MVQLFGLIYPQRCVADNGKMRVIVFEIKIVKHIQVVNFKEWRFKHSYIELAEGGQ